MSTVKFNNKRCNIFPELKQRINQYFEQNKIKPTGNLKLYAQNHYTFHRFSGTLYCIIFFYPENGWLSLLLASLFRFGNGIYWFFNVMHDGHMAATQS